MDAGISGPLDSERECPANSQADRYDDGDHYSRVTEYGVFQDAEDRSSASQKRGLGEKDDGDEGARRAWIGGASWGNSGDENMPGERLYGGKPSNIRKSQSRTPPL